MNATKRKFNALLQGIGARSTPSVSSSDTNNPPAAVSSFGAGAPLTSTTSRASANAPDPTMPFLSGDFLKRRRVGAPNAVATRDGSETTPPHPNKSGLPTVVLRKTSGPRGQDQGSLPTPRYCPGDRDQLLRRLATFQEITDWTPKPDPVNEIEWAKRGWVCQGKERLRCTLCNKEIVVKLNRREVNGKEVPVLVASEIEEALVEKYVELMVTSHQEDCLWRKRGSDDHLIRLPLANPKQALDSLRQRYDELCARQAFLPYQFNIRLPEALNLDATLRDLPPNFFTEPASPPTNPSSPDRAALGLALMGWQGLTSARIGAVPNSASCHSCLRRLGLWMFKSKEVDPDTGAVLVPAMMDHLDPLREHRFFCPWKNGDVQRNPGGGGAGAAALAPSRRGNTKNGGSASSANPAGWEVLVQVIRNDAFLRNRTNGGGGLGTRVFGHKGSKSVGGQPARQTNNNNNNNNDDDHDAAVAGGPGTPVRPSTSGAGALQPPPPLLLGPDGVEQDGEGEGELDEAARNLKDKERWARLRRVKSLFDTKGTKKLRRGLGSRPGTAHSNAASSRPESRSAGGETPTAG